MIYALTVARNEVSRYLRPMIAALFGEVAGHVVFDDQSTDGTGDVAAELGCVVVRRADGEPSFAENEGMFRQAALAAFERAVQPEIGDWVFSVDADEIAMARNWSPDAAPDEKAMVLGDRLRELVSEASDGGFMGVNVSIPEVWARVNGQFLLRVDGWWARGIAPRLFAWRPGGSYASWDGHQLRFARMGCPSAPTYVTEPYLFNDDVVLLHLGYLSEEDRRAKVARYAENPGLHQAAHLRSILARPQLLPLVGNAPMLEL